MDHSPLFIEKPSKLTNENQRRVVNEATSIVCDTSTNQVKVYTVQGPPGTGRKGFLKFYFLKNRNDVNDILWNITNRAVRNQMQVMDR